MEKILWIMRGISGSGKSTWIEENKPEGAVVASADHYFLTEDGQYEFDPTQLQDAHDRAFAVAHEGLRDGVEVFVDNTNLSVAELSPYRMLARRYGYEVRYVECRCDADEAAERSLHAPADAVQAQADRGLEDLPPFFEGEVQVIETG